MLFTVYHKNLIYPLFLKKEKKIPIIEPIKSSQTTCLIPRSFFPTKSRGELLSKLELDGGIRITAEGWKQNRNGGE